MSTSNVAKEVCHKASLFGEDYKILSKASDVKSSNWMVLLLFGALLIFFGWVIINNIVSIYRVYTQYNDNVNYKLKDADGYIQDPTDPAFDNEVYNSPQGSDPLYRDNSYIRKNITDLRKKYQKYNVELQKADKGEDVVDEKVLSNMDDNYILPAKADSSD
jgi:hypothetical protein